MANETTKIGLVPVRKVGGSPFTGGQQRYRIASGATTAIFQGDLVTQLTAGTIGRHAASGTVPIVGVFNGVSLTPGWCCTPFQSPAKRTWNTL